MSNDSHNREQYKSQEYLKRAQEVYGFALNGGIYKSTGNKSESDGAHQPKYSDPIIVSSLTSGSLLFWAVFSAAVSFATFLAVFFYTGFSRGQLDEMRRATQKTGIAADAARSSAQTAADSMHIDQRAWIGITVGRSQMTNGKPLTMAIRIANTGKTPAFKMHGNIVANLLREDEEPDFLYKHGHPRYEVGGGGQTLVPNLPQDMQYAALPKYDESPNEPLPPIIVDDSIRQAIETGKSYIVVHGKITYYDVFGIEHWIRFCHYAHNVVGFQERSVASTCGPYNDTDKDK